MTPAKIKQETKAAEEGLGQAISAHEAARTELAQAQADRTALHARLSNGDATVTATDIAGADAAVRRAELLEEAAAAAIEPAKARIATADLAAVIEDARAYAASGPDDEIRQANRAVADAQRHVEELTAHMHRKIREFAHDLRARGATRVHPGADTTGWVGSLRTPEGFNIAGGPTLSTWDDLR